MVLTSVQREFICSTPFVSMRSVKSDTCYVYCPPSGLSPRIVEVVGFRYRKGDVPVAYIRDYREDGTVSPHVAESETLWFKRCPNAYLKSGKSVSVVGRARIHLPLEMKPRKEAVVGR